MKRFIWCINVTALLLLFAAVAVAGMSGPYGKTTASKTIDISPTLVSTVDGNELLGRPVANLRGEHLGTISELIKDKDVDRYVYALVEITPAGMGSSRFVVVPFTALTEDFGSDKIILDVSRTWLQKAPSFDRDQRQKMADHQWGADIHRLYGQRPYWK